jgi:hypothetical protein
MKFAKKLKNNCLLLDLIPLKDEFIQAFFYWRIFSSLPNRLNRLLGLLYKAGAFTASTTMLVINNS